MTRPVAVKGSKITIGGLCGTGKGTVSNVLARILGYKLMSAGKYFRNISIEMGIPLEELEVLAKSDPVYDLRVDRETEQFGLINDHLVFEGRLAWYFIEGVSILLTCDFNERVARVAKREKILFEEAKNATINREASARERYSKIYNISDITDPRHYAFVVDTTNIPADEVVEKIIAFLKITGAYHPLLLKA